MSMDMLGDRSDSDNDIDEEISDTQSVLSARKVTLQPLYILNNAFNKA